MEDMVTEPIIFATWKYLFSTHFTIDHDCGLQKYSFAALCWPKIDHNEREAVLFSTFHPSGPY